MVGPNVDPSPLDAASYLEFGTDPLKRASCPPDRVKAHGLPLVYQRFPRRGFRLRVLPKTYLEYSGRRSNGPPYVAATLWLQSSLVCIPKHLFHRHLGTSSLATNTDLVATVA